LTIDKVAVVDPRGLFLVDVFEVVTKKNGMLFKVSLAQVEELLAGTIKIRHVFHFSEHLHVFFEGNHCDKASYPFNRVWISFEVTF